MKTEPDFTPSNKPRFDPTINLGHLLTAMMMAAALLTMWTNLRVTQAQADSRLAILEKSQQKTEETIGKLADNASTSARTQDKLGLTLDFLAKQVAMKP